MTIAFQAISAGPTPAARIMKNITFFYGNGCPFCAAIMPAVERLEKEDNVRFERLEVWRGGRMDREYNKENQDKMESLKRHYETNCGGNMIVPSFYDAEKDRLICNPGTYENLKSWIFA